MSQMDMPPVTSLDSVLNAWARTAPGGVSVAALDSLRTALLVREDNIADLLRLAGVQFGLFSEIVAEVLAEVGLGSPIDDDQRMFIRRQFAALMERLQTEFGTDNG